MPQFTIHRRGITTQPQWLCTAPAPGEQGPRRYNAAGASSVIIHAINGECAQAIAHCHGLRLDGRLITPAP